MEADEVLRDLLLVKLSWSRGFILDCSADARSSSDKQAPDYSATKDFNSNIKS